MEVQEIMDRWGPWPWLLFQYEANSRVKLVSLLSDDDEPHVSFVPELEKKSVKNCCHGWLILSIEDFCHTKFSLWNPVSLESINLPPLHGLCINACILSSDPSSLDSTVFLFNRGTKNILYCRIHSDDRRWISQCYEKEISDINVDKFGSDDSLPKRNTNDDHLHTPVICNGKLYCLTYNRLILVQIEVLEKENGIVLLIQPLIQLPCPPEQSVPGHRKQQLIESCEDIFTVSISSEHRNRNARFGNEIIGVEVHKLNLSAMAWERTTSVGHLAFFTCDGDIAFSCSAKISGLRGNHLYFTRKQDFRLYSYDIEEGMLSVRLPCPNKQTPWESVLWIMPHIRSTNSFGQALSIYEKDEVNQEKELLEAGEKESNISNPISSPELPLDILKDISQRLDFFAYKNFGTLSTNWRRASSPYEINPFVSPWLLYFQKNKGIFNIIGPKGSKRYLVQVPESLRDATICYCKESWLLMCKYTGTQAHQISVNFVNPFNKNVIQYPDLSLKNFCWSKFSFSCSPTSSNCLVIVMPYPGSECLKVCSSREEGWKNLSLGVHFCYPESFCTNQIFANGNFYFMTQYRELGVFRLEGDRSDFDLRYAEKSHLSQYQSFLAEHNGELISCFVNDLGKSLIFKFNSSTRHWEELTSLGKYTMYVSRMSSFLTKAKTPEMEDKIYLPKFHEDGSMVSLCLKTGKYSSGSSEVSSNDLNGTREQLWACWIRLN